MKASGLTDLLFIYQKFASAENKSPRTIETTAHAIRLFDRFLDHCADVNLVKVEELRGFISELQNRSKWENHPTIKANHGPLSPFTIANYVRHIQAFWSWLYSEEFILDNPLKRVKVPGVPRPIINVFTPDQVKLLLATISRNNHKGYRDYTIILLLYGIGLRISEVVALKTESVNFDTGNIKVSGKGAKERILYMPPTVYKAMFKYYTRWRPKICAEYFFVSEEGKQLSRFTFEHLMHKYGREAGITGVACRPHIMRYTFAIEFLRNGGDIFTLQKILGHETLEMTRRYARLADRDVEAKLKTSSPVEKLKLRV